MHLLCMDAGYEPSTPGSLSAEECFSNSSGLERNREDEQLEPQSTKRREKNRDAARKSRRKQTERADELHEELQSLEQSNAAFQKEIAVLKKELRVYEMALEHHKPHCCLRTSASPPASSPAQLSVSSSADCQTSSSLSRASNSPSPSLSASSNPSMGPQTFDYIEKAHFSPSASSPTTTTAASEIPASSSSASSPATIPYSVSFCTQPTLQPLFSKLPPITPRLANVMPVCAKPAQYKTVHERSSASQGSSFTNHAFLMKLDSSLSASSAVQAPFSHLQPKNTSTASQDCSLTAAQFSSCNFSGNLNSSHQLCTLLPSPLQDSLPVSSQVGVEPPLTSPFASKWRYSESVSAASGSLLSRLTVPSPPNISQTTSSSFHGSASQTPLPLLPDLPEDPSLSELLEINDWILSGINNN